MRSEFACENVVEETAKGSCVFDESLRAEVSRMKSQDELQFGEKCRIGSRQCREIGLGAAVSVGPCLGKLK